MKATLEFDLPEEQQEFEIATNGNKYYSAIYEFDQYLRSKIKYSNLPENIEECLSGIREKLYLILQDNDINL